MANQQPLSEYERQSGHVEAGQGSGLVRYITGLFEAFKTARKPWEDLWEELWLNFIGEYQTGTVWRKTEGRAQRSRAFVKLTALKCHTAHSKIIDVLFPGHGQIPFDAIPVFYQELGIDVNEAKKAAATAKSYLKDHFRDIELEETLDTGILEMAILGTGVMKGPILENRRRQSLRVRTVGGVPLSSFENELKPYESVYQEELTPVVDHVPLWEYYTDINAGTNKDAIGEIHFQRMLPEKFRQLAGVGGYDREGVLEAARRATAADPNDQRRVQLGDNYTGEHGDKDKRVSVLEFWGLVPARTLQEAGAELPEGTDMEGDVEALVVLAADGIVCKAVVNPLGYRPFWVCPYKKRPHVIYGTGVAEMMRDSQRIINSAVRLIIDNKALSGPGMVGINLDRINTKKTKDLTIYPGKTWYVRGNFSPREAIDTVSFADVSHGLVELVQMFERFADEETGLPKYTSGEQDSFLNKMLDVNTAVPMADGSIKLLMDIQDGDSIIGSKGTAVKVAKAHEIHLPERAYEIVFQSGDIIKAGGEHLWTIQTAKQASSGGFSTLNTDALYEKFNKHKTEIFIPRIQRPRFGSSSELPIDPYILGLWLGNGHAHGARITIRDEDVDVVQYVKCWAVENGADMTLDKHQNGGKSKTYSIGGYEGNRDEEGRFKPNGSLRSLLASLGLLKQDNGGKRIPETYFLAPYEDRLALLRGLMDSDGCHHSGALVIFTQKEGALINDVVKLIEGLGGFPTLHRTYPGVLAKENTCYYNVHFSLIDNPFRFSERAKKWQTPKNKIDRQRILAITPVDICEMRCLTVDAEDGLYAVGNRYTLTHNTAAGMAMLMTQANINIKTVLKNIDNFWLEPIIEVFYEWFSEMQPGFAPLPMKIKAIGTDSLMAKELKMESYMKFMQVTAAPQDAIFMDRTKLLTNIARLLDTEDVLRPEQEMAALMAEFTKQAQSRRDMREMVDIDRLYPLLTRTEQMQVLANLGIEPDVGQRQAVTGQESRVAIAEAKRKGGPDGTGGV